MNHWYSRQGDKKVWPLKFLKPERNAVAAVEPESVRGRWDSTVSGGEPQEEDIDDKGSDIEAHEDGEIEVDDGDTDNVSQQISVEQVTGMGDEESSRDWGSAHHFGPGGRTPVETVFKVFVKLWWISKANRVVGCRGCK